MGAARSIPETRAPRVGCTGSMRSAAMRILPAARYRRSGRRAIVRRMSDLPGCLLVVTVEIDPAVEAEWNRWYDTVHLPDALRCPGVLRGRRYVSSGDISETVRGRAEKERAPHLHHRLRARQPGRH